MPPVPDSLKKNSVKNAGAAPTTELGAVLNAIMGGVFSPAGMAAWTNFTDDQEYVPELKWPKSVKVYNQMSTDTQIAALENGTVLPIRHFNWTVDPNDADPARVEQFARDINMPILGDDNKKQPKLRQRRRLSFGEHLRMALKAPRYGHYFFEQVGYIGDDGLWHLSKLAERPPDTIQAITVAPDGGLVSITQNLNINSRSSMLGQFPEIPVDRLVAYVWEKEGGNWTGRSWYRECYRNWLLKDRLMRIDVINHEKAGGVPIGIAPPGATPTQVRQIGEFARDFNVGMESGGGLPAGSSVDVVKAASSDVVGSMRYHDEAMARRFLLMVMQLGQTQTGSRALGTTFVDFFGQGLVAIADWFVDVFCDHVVEDYWDWNWGYVEDEPTARLAYEFDPELAAQDVANLIKVGAITVDDDLEEELRRELGLPRMGTPRDNKILVQPPPEQPPGKTPPNQGTSAPGPKAEHTRVASNPEGAPSQVAAGHSPKPYDWQEED